MSRQRTMLGWLFFSLVFAALAAITKSQGIAIFVVATILTALVVVRRYKRVAVAIWFIGFISTASFVVLVDASVQRTANPIAKLFGPKTLFCFYLNGYLAAENVRINSLKEFGFASEEFYERLLVSYRSPGGGFKTLGYNADACQFDRKIDEIAIQQLGGISQASSWYLRAFVSTIFEKPIPYLYKITSQILYSLKMSIPPHGLFSYNFGVDERRIIVKDLLTDAGFGKAASSFTVSGVAGSVLGHSESRALVYFYRLVSIIVGLFLVAPFLLVFFADFRRSKLLWMGMSASLFWFAQVGVIALIHSTDVWRYLIPVVPAALLCSALVGTMFIQQILRKRCAA